MEIDTSQPDPVVELHMDNEMIVLPIPVLGAVAELSNTVFSMFAQAIESELEAGEGADEETPESEDDDEALFDPFPFAIPSAGRA
jgi:hypothetical protein